MPHSPLRFALRVSQSVFSDQISVHLLIRQIFIKDLILVSGCLDQETCYILREKIILCMKTVWILKAQNGIPSVNYFKRKSLKIWAGDRILTFCFLPFCVDGFLVLPEGVTRVIDILLGPASVHVCVKLF